MADYYDVPSDIPLVSQYAQGIQRQDQQPVDPQEELFRRAMAERDKIMAERNQSAPTYLPGQGAQGSYASVPHTAGYAGPTRQSDIAPKGGMADGGVLRSNAENYALGERNRMRNIPLAGGKPGQTYGSLMDMLASSRGAPKELQDALARTQFGIDPQQFRSSTFTKPITPEQAGKMFKYDANTMGFMPMQAEDYDKTPLQLGKEGFRIITQSQADSAKSLPLMMNSFQKVKDAYGELSKQSWAKRLIGDTPGVGSYLNNTVADYKKSVQQFTTFFDAEIMGKRGASSPQMQNLRSRVLPGIEMDPEIGGKLISDFNEILKIVKNNQITMLSGKIPDLTEEDKAATALGKKYDVLAPPGSQSPGANPGVAVGARVPAPTAAPKVGIVPGKVGPHGRPIYFDGKGYREQ